jgi:hypothetical protein
MTSGYRTGTRCVASMVCALVVLLSGVCLVGGCERADEREGDTGDDSWYVEGVVTDSASGVVLASVEVEMRDATGNRWQDTTDTTGEYRIAAGFSLNRVLEFRKEAYRTLMLELDGVGSCDSIVAGACVKNARMVADVKWRRGGGPAR